MSVARGGRLRGGLEIMAGLARLGERGDAGPNSTTGRAEHHVRAW
jgi:hypothetical protein